MAKKKELSLEDEIEALCVLAEARGLPDDAFDRDLADACENAKQLALAEICGASWSDKLAFLVGDGYAIGRLRELIEEWEDGDGV